MAQLYPHRKFWFAFRAVMVLGILLVAIGLYYDIHIPFLFGLSVREIFWLILLPIIVVIMYLAPMLWRNICPLATVSMWRYAMFGRRKLSKIGIKANELTGVMGVLHDLIRKRGLLVSVLLFWSIIPYRLIAFNADSHATFWLVAAVFGAAFVFGALFPVKSGWCTSICPMAAAEKAYGMNPAIEVKNNRCYFLNQPENKVMSCSGCSFNCWDVVEPEFGYWQASGQGIFHATLNAHMRKVFVATLPGFMLAFSLVSSKVLVIPGAGGAKVFTLYAFFAVMMVLSAVVYYTFKAMKKKSIRKSIVDSKEAETAYSVAKRRLDLFVVGLSMNVIWVFLSYAWTHSLLVKIFAIDEVAQGVLWTILVFAFFFVSLGGMRSGWNEKPGVGNYRTSWW